MDKEITMFGDIKIEKHKFHHYKRPLFKDVNTDNVLISNKNSSGEKEL